MKGEFNRLFKNSYHNKYRNAVRKYSGKRLKRIMRSLKYKIKVEALNNLKDEIDRMKNTALSSPIISSANLPDFDALKEEVSRAIDLYWAINARAQ